MPTLRYPACSFLDSLNLGKAEDAVGRVYFPESQGACDPTAHFTVRGDDTSPVATPPD